MRRLLAIALVGVVLVVGTGVPAAATTPEATTDHGAREPAPVFAYFYQWFDTASWDRAKSDYPLQGRYSSDDVEVLRRQVQTAKDAGITGFIVSWKSTEVNNRRLRNLVEVARAEDFSLAVIYQGLDFDRNPLPAQRVASDFRYFRDTFAADPVFRLRSRPLLIWSGTWKFSRADLASAVAPVRADIDVLASEKDTEGYERVADLVAGNAYYWSSVDPTRYKGFAQRLREMADLVHSHGGLWVAPFAPGFDARMVGGTRAVDRREGATLYEEYAAAVASSPDLLGLISWNEFSENTHIEPSERFGDRYVQALRDVLDAPVADAAGEVAQDSSDSDGTVPAGLPVGPVRLALAGASGLVVLAIVTWVRRRRATGGRHSRGPGSHRRRRVRTAGTTLVILVAAATSLVGCRPTWASAQEPAPPTLPPSPSRFFQGAQPVDDPSQVVVAAAGDIACAQDPAGLKSEERNSAIRCQSAATADLVTALGPDAVLTLGDHQYPNGSLERFRAGYDRTWGRFLPITHPVPGNHEYGTKGAEGYFAYFGPAAGSPEAGYYSYDLGPWHVVALNSECRHIGGCEAGSAEERWLRDDLAAHPAACTLAYWHQARFSTGSHGSVPATAALWRALQDGGADLVLSGHDHDYERFAPLDADGVPGPTGIPSFVVGTGGDSYYRIHEPISGMEVGITSSPGVLELTLTPDGFEWAFRTVDPTPAGTVADSGVARCSTPNPTSTK